MVKWLDRINRIPWMTVIYTVIFGFICVISQRVHTAGIPEGWKESFRDMLGFAIAALIFLHYKKADFVHYHRYHIGWAVIGAVVCSVLFLIRKDHAIHLNDWIVVVIEIYVWGFVLIQTIGTVFAEKIRPRFHKIPLAIWLAMMGWMICSRSDEMWPLPYLIVFLCFYVTNFNQKDREYMYQGILNGIIAAFFTFQAHAFLYRPYDEVRYLGWFSNSNNNSLFYCFVLAAVCVKLYLCKQKGANKWWHIYYWLGVGTVFSFEIMTIGRMGWITAFAVAFIWLVYMKKHFGKSILAYGTLILLVTAITFPLCFAAVRYIPPLRHHVVWFYGEYREDKVHSWHKWDDERFVDIDEFAEAAVGRIALSFEELLQNLPFVVEAEAAGLPDRDVPRLADEFGANGYKIRETIYKTFIETLNFRGYPSTEIGFQLTSWFWVYHAHDLYLQFGTQFGWPVMILFIILIIISIVKSFRLFHHIKAPEMLCYGYLILIPALFGMFEYTWGAGHMAITLLFIAWRMVLTKSE